MVERKDANPPSPAPSNPRQGRRSSPQGDVTSVISWLHEAWLLLPDHAVQLRTPQIETWDDRFNAATVADHGLALAQTFTLPLPTCGGRGVIPAFSQEPWGTPFAPPALSELPQRRPLRATHLRDNP
jgi:hypothetical protein